MWNTLIRDLIVALIGSALTVAIAAATFLSSRRYRETQAINLQPSRYWFFLDELRDDIAAQVQRLSDANSRIIALEPGTGSL